MPMRTYNKLFLAAEMFMDAERRYRDAKSDIDFIGVILVAGAAAYIVFPLVEEQGGTPVRNFIADLCNGFQPLEEGEEPTKPRDFLWSYNALKHLGSRGSKKPSSDLELRVNLHVEAGSLLDETKHDFMQLNLDEDTMAKFPHGFFELIHNGRTYYPD
jgi:hypothetical protein